MLYYICIAGMAVWGYQFGFLKSYLHRGKDALGRKKDETLHEANVKLQLHSNHLFFPAAKAIVAGAPPSAEGGARPAPTAKAATFFNC